MVTRLDRQGGGWNFPGIERVAVSPMMISLQIGTSKPFTETRELTDGDFLSIKVTLKRTFKKFGQVTTVNQYLIP
jgi:hypothetical protein